MTGAGLANSEENVFSVPATQMKDWINRFRYYRDPPDETKISEWLGYFQDLHKPIASKILDKVMVVSERTIHIGYKAALTGLPGWHRDPIQRIGRWYFVGFGSQGESGPAMLRPFREANELASDKYQDLFKTLSDLPSLQLTAYDSVVFVDDFSGTGDQIKRFWPTIFELVASEAKCYLALTALTTTAEAVIASNTELIVRSEIVLGPEYSIFHAENDSFTTDEKDIIRSYCQIADKDNPQGYGGLGILFVLSHKTPNNALPILYQNAEYWRGLFPRYLRAA